MRLMDKISRPGIRILRSIYNGTSTLKELAEEHGVGHSSVSRMATHLEMRGFIVKGKKGNSVRIAFSGNPFVEYFKQMLARKLQLENILGGAGLRLFLTLAMPGMSGPGNAGKDILMDIHQIHAFSGLARATIYRSLSDAAYAGAIRKEGDKYGIAGSMGMLREFIRLYSLHMATLRLKMLPEVTGIDDSGLVLHFVSGSEFIFSVPTGSSIERYRSSYPTGLTAFQYDGLDFLTDRDYYHFTRDRYPLRTEDHAADILLIDRESSRYAQYSLLYLKKNMGQIHRDYLRDLGEIFGLSRELDAMIAFLDDDTSGKPSRAGNAQRGAMAIPGHDEFDALCRQYGVK